MELHGLSCLQRGGDLNQHCKNKTIGKLRELLETRSPIMKSMICDIIEEGNSCLINEAQKRCPGNKKVKKYYNGLRSALDAPCKGTYKLKGASNSGKSEVEKQMIALMVIFVFVWKHFGYI